MELWKEEIKLDGHSEIDDWFFITSHIFLRIYLRDCVICSLLRGILVYRIYKRNTKLLLYS